MPEAQENPHDPTDGGRHGESHSDDESHHTLYRDDSHISWDTDKDGNYKQGSGHTTDHGSGRVSRWDP